MFFSADLSFSYSDLSSCYKCLAFWSWLDSLFRERADMLMEDLEELRKVFLMNFIMHKFELNEKMTN